MAKKTVERTMVTYKCLQTCYFKKTLVMEDQIVKVDSSTEMPDKLFEKVTDREIMAEAVANQTGEHLNLEPNEAPDNDVNIVQ